MRINRLFWLLTVVIVAITASVAARSLWLNWQTWTETVRASEQLEIFRLALVSAEMASRERGPANGLLGADVPAPAAIRNNLDHARQTTDKAFDALLERLKSATPPRTNDVQTIQRAVAQLDAARRDIDTVAALPRDARPSRAVSSAVGKMFEVIDLLQPAISNIQFDLIQAAPSAASQVIVARLLTEIREYTGRIGSDLTSALTLDQPLSVRQEVALERDTGRVEELVELVRTRVSQSDKDPNIGLGMKEIDAKYFGVGLALVNRLHEASRNHAPYGMSAAEFAARYVPTMEAAVHMRDMELDALAAHIGRMQDGARVHLALSAGYALLLLVTVLVPLLAFKHKVIEPIADLSRGFAAEARGTQGLAKPGGVIGYLQQGFQRLQAANDQNALLENQREQALGFISHDLRSPLASIIALVETRSRTSSSDDELATGQRILRHAKRMLAQLDDYLALVQAESKSWIPDDVDLVSVIGEAVDDAWVQARQKHVRIVAQAAPDSAYVCGNHWMLFRCVSNLVNNAIKFSPPQSEVEIKVSREPGAWKVSVTDFGEGIPKALLPKLFSPFPRAHDTQERAGSGIGLGLAFVRTVVVRHGGSVSVSSAPSSGTTFFFTLPEADALENRSGFMQMAGAQP